MKRSDWKSFSFGTDLNEYSFYLELQNGYLKHDWLAWKFKRLPFGYWNRIENRLEYIEWLSKELQIKKLDDWMNVRREDFIKHGGIELLIQFDNSIIKLLKSIYPEHK